MKLLLVLFLYFFHSINAFGQTDDLQRLQSLLQRLENIKVEFKDMQDEAKLLAQKNNQLQSDLAVCESASMGVEKQLYARNIEIENLQKIFNEQAAILASNSKQLLDLNQAKNDVEAEFARLQTTKEKELSDLNQENKNLKNQLAEIDLEYSEKLDEVINRNERTFVNLDKENINLMAQLEKSEAKVQSLSKKLAKTSEKLAAICPSCELE